MIQMPYTPVKTLQKAFGLLETLGTKQSASPPELVRELGLSRSNVHRFLTTLREMGYVEKASDSRYRLTFKMFILGSTRLRGIKIADIAHPYMVSLAEVSEENVNLAVMSDQKVLYLDKIESPHYLRLDKPIGETDPVYCTALGKALLSGLADRELEIFLRSVKLTPRTRKTIVDPVALARVIQKVRKEGYATDFEELSYGIHCIAAPIYDYTNRVVAAISVSGPSVRLTRKKIEALKRRVIETSTQISKGLGSTSFDQ